MLRFIDSNFKIRTGRVTLKPVVNVLFMALSLLLPR